MSEDSETGAKESGAAPAADSIALAGASRAKADAFLDVQIRLARLQSQNLVELNTFELSHLRWRRFNDQMKGALQIMAVAVGALIVIGIAAAVWNASQADGIVVDAFAVPPQLAASGISGDVIADDVTNKLIAIRDIANAHSLGRSKDVRQDSGADIKVEIPDTGISVSEAWRYLRAWLGHEHHLRGSLRMTAGDIIVLTLNGEGAASFRGHAADLDALEQKAAEHISANADAEQFVVYLAVMHRPAEALELSERTAETATENRADAYALWSNTLTDQGHARRALAVAHFAISIDPKIATPHLEASYDASLLGHDEEYLQQVLEIAKLKDADQPVYERGEGFARMLAIAAYNRDLCLADFNHAFFDRYADHAQSPPFERDAFLAARLHDGARARANIADALAAGSTGDSHLGLARYFADAVSGNWDAAAAQARLLATALKTDDPGGGALLAGTEATPMLAYALAQGGDMAGARAAIATTPLDCYDCLVKRGDVEAAAHNWAMAANWFAQAVQAAPSIPFAYADWGAMLLAKGDFDGAIVEFANANKRSPHFADPLELWGEALVARNRSDLALAKFAEAARDAPNWGRLHLKWGEALLWSGDADGAQRQFALAAALFLTPHEAAELARARGRHG